MVVVLPFFSGVYYSFTDWNAIPGREVGFIGLKNYLNVFQDVQVLKALGTTLVYGTYSIILINIVGFSLALLVTQKMRSANLLRTVFFMPNLIGGLILGYVWKFVFLKIVPVLFQTDFTMLEATQTSLLAMAIVSTWQMGGYIMVIYVAAIQAIPEELLEAADIDGAGPGQKIRNIVFPLVAPAFTVSLFMTLSNAFKMFDVNVSLTGGDPARSTELLALEIFSKAFKELNFGEGQAQAVLFFILVAAITAVQVTITKKREVEM
ncbi:sugar ABC transporter permease [Clostridiales bacterium F-3ap]|uniref:Sugar ABC transporter permease n=2 Tax=Anaerotalea alkaliphila TaxID=2662126 RepID=A0A7X5HV93_9FIRM|nr:sugar ABC transporter permease [Anaerotalea alkaliphila]